MKEILLIDFDSKVMNSIVDNELLNLHTIIVGTQEEANHIKAQYDIKNIYTVEKMQEVYMNTTFTLNYNLLAKFKHTQVKVENWFQRFTSDVNMTQLLYATALCFWDEYFTKNNIDIVFSSGQEWGSNFDSLIFDVAVEYKKEVYILENTFVDGKDMVAQSIFDYVNKKYVKIHQYQDANSVDVDITNFLYYSQSDKIFHKISSYKEILKQFPDKYGGFLMIMFLALIVGKYKSIHHSFNVSWWTYFKNFIHIKRMHKYYQSKAIKPDSKNKFIFFALHMEPEATTLARTIFSNQLTIIKAISECLPEDWILYVKDHPRQYSAMNNFKRYYFLTSLSSYRTKFFYDTISEIKNVKLIDLNINSEELIKSCEAVVTINGSIILESMVQYKPLLIFAQNSTPFYNLDEVFDIKNTNNIKMAMKSLVRGYKPLYRSLNKHIKDYTFNVDNTKEYDYSKIVGEIIK